MTKAGIFCHIIRHLLKNKNARIMVNDSRYPTAQVEGKNKLYTDRDVKRYRRTRQFQHITDQPINLILHAVDNKILHNLPILREDVRVAEEIYGPSVSYFQVKTVRHNIQHAEPVIVPSFSKEIFDKYNKVNLCCDLIHIKGIGFMNTTSQHIMFSTGSMVKNLKINNIEDGFKEVKKIYLQCGIKIMHIHYDNKFEPLRV